MTQAPDLCVRNLKHCGYSICHKVNDKIVVYNRIIYSIEDLLSAKINAEKWSREDNLQYFVRKIYIDCESIEKEVNNE